MYYQLFQETLYAVLRNCQYMQKLENSQAQPINNLQTPPQLPRQQKL
jgi:hypothetical protein